MPETSRSDWLQPTSSSDERLTDRDPVPFGWSLEDGEAYHRRSPTTFSIPSLDVRISLDAGDYAKLIFRFSDPESPEDADRDTFERMWVLIAARVGEGYYGWLENQPLTSPGVARLMKRSIIQFAPRHIIDVEFRDRSSIHRSRARRVRDGVLARLRKLGSALKL